MKSKICETCKHYMPHYIKRKVKFNKMSVGHCLIKKSYKDVTDNSTCERWIENIDEKIEQHQKIDAVLRKMAIEINDIRIILKNE